MSAQSNPREPGFAITGGKGFHITFENGWTASVQFGFGNYGGNYDWRGDGPMPSSRTAEIAAWGPDGAWATLPESGEEVAGYASPADVLAFLNRIAAISKAEGK